MTDSSIDFTRASRIHLKSLRRPLFSRNSQQLVGRGIRDRVLTQILHGESYQTTEPMSLILEQYHHFRLLDSIEDTLLIKYNSGLTKYN